MAWPSARAKTATAGGTWVPADMNAVQDQYIRADGIQPDDLQTSGVAQKLGVSQTGSPRRGKSIIATTESRSNAAYGLLTTPDRVSGIVLPADGLIAVCYQATWQESVNGAARAAIFIGANQLKLADRTAAAPQVQEAFTNVSAAAIDKPLNSYAGGLWGGGGGDATAHTGDVTTGQIVGAETSTSGLNALGGPCYIFAAAGTYDITVQFKAASGSVTAKNRKLWVWTQDH